jgi:hypothetical protein
MDTSKEFLVSVGGVTKKTTEAFYHHQWAIAVVSQLGDQARDILRRVLFRRLESVLLRSMPAACEMTPEDLGLIEVIINGDETGVFIIEHHLKLRLCHREICCTRSWCLDNEWCVQHGAIPKGLIDGRYV